MRIPVAVAISLGTLAVAQQYTVPFTGGSRPPLVKIDVYNGAVNVIGYDGKECIVKGDLHDKKAEKNGLHRLDNAGAFSFSEQNNVIAIHGGASHAANLSLQIPFATALEIKCTNCREVLVQGISGDIDVNTVNGGIRLVDVTGAVSAHALNKAIVATFDQFPGVKPISLSSMNGGIDVTFPSSLKANLRLKTNNGKIYTDFDVRLAGGTQMRLDKGLEGTVNGGGADMKFNTFNGSIYLRRKK